MSKESKHNTKRKKSNHNGKKQKGTIKTVKNK